MQILRLAWISAGLLFVGLGVLGVLLPLLPTTVFLLLAAYCFARSSPTLHDWLLGHRILGPFILNWQDYGAISARAKLLAVATMGATLAGGLALGLGNIVLAVQGVVLTLAAVFVLSRPTPPPG